jgi:hypothetical protein
LTLQEYAMRKFKRFRKRRTAAAIFLRELAGIRPARFEHWRFGITGANA